MLYTASDAFKILAYSALCFSGIWQHIQPYTTLLRYIHAYWDIIKPYAGLFPCVTLAYSQPCRFLSPSIFRTIGIFKTVWSVDQVYWDPCHGTLLRHILSAYTCRNLAYSVSWNFQNFQNCILTHIQNPVIFTEVYKYFAPWYISNTKRI